MHKMKNININEINSYLFKFKDKINFKIKFSFQIGILLGQGAFGIVKKCISKIDGKYYAIKKIE